MFRPSVAHDVANLPPVGSLFAAFLGYNPIGELLGPSGALTQPGVNADVLTGKTFFPQLITEPFHSGLTRGVHRRRGDDADRRGGVAVQPGPLRHRAPAPTTRRRLAVQIHPHRCVITRRGGALLAGLAFVARDLGVCTSPGLI